MKSLPTDYQFILAEDVRPEPGNKLNILGFHASPQILIPKSSTQQRERQPAIASLSFLVVFLDGEGHFTTEVEVIGPEKSRLFDVQKDTATKEPKRALTLVLKYSPFPIPAAGKYVFRITLDGKPYEYKFEIAYQEDFEQQSVRSSA